MNIIQFNNQYLALRNALDEGHEALTKALAEQHKNNQKMLDDLYDAVNEPNVPLPEDLRSKPAEWVIEQVVNYQLSTQGRYRAALRRVAEAFLEEHKRAMTVGDMADMPHSKYLRYIDLGPKALQTLEDVLVKYKIILRDW